MGREIVRVGDIVRGGEYVREEISRGMSYCFDFVTL